MSLLQRPGVKRDLLIVAVLLLCAVAFKWVYLQTAESSYNIEELPLPALTLAGDIRAQANIATTRLYGTAPITTALSLQAFGFTPLGLKFPNIVAFLLTAVFLGLFARRLPALRDSGLWWLPVLLWVMGPPVLQIWGMKNRGGFIETMLALAICLWMCARHQESPLPPLDKLLLALVIGIATWSQPIALVWGVVILAYVFWQDARFAPRALPQTTLLLVLGLVIGLLPLINLNFLFNFNTFAVLNEGEKIQGVDLGVAGRARELLIAGFPRLLGLKEQWRPEWLLWPPAARALYLVFLLPLAWACIGIVRDSIVRRRFSVELLVLGAGGIVLAANLLSSWGNFQAEPRRLLLLYVPFVILTALGLARARRFLLPFLLLWCGYNLWANYAYVHKYRDGFSLPAYQRLDDVAAYLQRKKMVGVYTDVWTGGRVTFASQGKVPWYPSKYEPTPHGYLGDAILNTNEAMIFNLNAPGGVEGRQNFWSDVRGAAIPCVEKVFGKTAIIHCTRRIDIDDLAMAARAHQQKPGDVVLDLKAGDETMLSLVGAKRDGVLASTGKPGFLTYGPYKSLPVGRYRLEANGTSSTPFVIDVAKDTGQRVLGKASLAAAQDPATQRLATLEFELAKPATDLEVRIVVPPNSDLRLQGYRIVVR
jgi:hypothetical protein